MLDLYQDLLIVFEDRNNLTRYGPAILPCATSLQSAVRRILFAVVQQFTISWNSYMSLWWENKSGIGVGT